MSGFRSHLRVAAGTDPNLSVERVAPAKRAVPTNELTGWPSRTVSRRFQGPRTCPCAVPRKPSKNVPPRNPAKRALSQPVFLGQFQRKSRITETPSRSPPGRSVEIASIACTESIVKTPPTVYFGASCDRTASLLARRLGIGCQCHLNSEPWGLVSDDQCLSPTQSMS